MLAPVKHLLARKRIILGSTSPRRRELLKMIGLNPEIRSTDFIEDTAPGAVEDVVRKITVDKLNATLSSMHEELRGEDYLVIVADTIVTIDGDLLGKPKDDADAKLTLQRLSGNRNRVFTCVGMATPTGTCDFTEFTDVYFSKLSEEQIEAYIKTREPMDKAGSYGIQGVGGSLISRIEGDYYTVMGFPLNRFCVEVTKMLQNEEDARSYKQSTLNKTAE